MTPHSGRPYRHGDVNLNAAKVVGLEVPAMRVHFVHICR